MNIEKDKKFFDLVNSEEEENLKDWEKVKNLVNYDDSENEADFVNFWEQYRKRCFIIHLLIIKHPSNEYPSNRFKLNR